MKRSLLFTLLTACSVPLATAASISNDDYAYTGDRLELSDADIFSDSGDFAISIDLGSALADAGDMVDFKFGFGEGEGGVGCSVSFAYAPAYNLMTYSGNGSTSTLWLDGPITADTLLLQISGFYGDTPLASLSYYENDTLVELWATTIAPNKDGKLPEAVTTANISISAPNIPMSEDNGITITTWQGEVSESDIKEPTYLPAAPAVPEPTTAVLSLLALTGLAARRRR